MGGSCTKINVEGKAPQAAERLQTKGCGGWLWGARSDAQSMQGRHEAVREDRRSILSPLVPLKNSNRRQDGGDESDYDVLDHWSCKLEVISCKSAAPVRTHGSCVRLIHPMLFALLSHPVRDDSSLTKLLRKSGCFNPYSFHKICFLQLRSYKMLANLWLDAYLIAESMNVQN